MIIPSSGLKQDKPLTVREPHPETAKPKGRRAEARDVLDLMRAVNGFAFLICACGLKIKVPPDFEESNIPCPRCGRENEIPKASVSDIAEAAAVVGAMVGTLANGGAETIPTAEETRPGGKHGAKAPPLEYRRKSDTWESFNCSCGKLIQLSPAFSAHQITCRNCSRIIKIDP